MLCRMRRFVWILPSQKKTINCKYASRCLWDQKRNFRGSQDPQPKEDRVSENIKDSQSLYTRHRKPHTNTPFIKNLFLGKIDTKMLVFPEALNQDELKVLDDYVEPLEKYFKEGINSSKMDEMAQIPDEVMKQLKDFGLFAQRIPQDYGGRGQTATELARLAEVFGVNESVGVMLSAHQTLGLEGLISSGNDEQKAKYFPKLASGEHIAAFCLTEANSGSDAASIESYAKLSDDGKSYIINGEKTWVTNGDKADIFTVFAKTDIQLHMGDTTNKLTAFIVERNFGGVTTGQPNDKMGIRAANTCSVKFENTPVPIENVLGGVGSGFKVAMTILNNSRYLIGSLCTGVMKKLLNLATEYAISRKQFGKPLREYGMIQEKISRTAVNLYAAESMTYLTAALMDSYAHPDSAVESAAVKVFASEALILAANECMQVMGACGYSKDQEFEQHLRNSFAYLNYQGTNEILRIYIALMGFQHAGVALQDTVRKMRDPLNNVWFTLKMRFERVKTNRKNPSLEMKLYNHVHPDLSIAGEALELRIVKFQYVAEKYMSTFADKLFEEQIALRRFADVAIDIFGTTACLARASRSKCIGLRNNDHEIMLARTFTADALTRVDKGLDELNQGKFTNGDETRVKIAEKVFKNHGYAAENPLTRNW